MLPLQFFRAFSPVFLPLEKFYLNRKKRTNFPPRGVLLMEKKKFILLSFSALFFLVISFFTQTICVRSSKRFLGSCIANKLFHHIQLAARFFFPPLFASENFLLWKLILRLILILLFVSFFFSPDPDTTWATIRR